MCSCKYVVKSEINLKRVYFNVSSLSAVIKKNYNNKYNVMSLLLIN